MVHVIEPNDWEYYSIRVQASQGKIKYPEPDKWTRLNYYVIYQTEDQTYNGRSEYYCDITETWKGERTVWKRHGLNSKELDSQATGLTGPIGLEDLIEGLPSNYVFTQSLNALQTLTFDSFTLATQDNEKLNLKTGDHYLIIPIKALEAEKINSIEDLQDNVPIVFKSASHFNVVATGIIYPKLPLGTKATLQDFKNKENAVDQNQALIKALAKSVKDNTHYSYIENFAFLTSMTLEEFIQDLVPIGSGPDNSEVLFYQTKSVWEFDDPRMESHLTRFLKSQEEMSSYLKSDESNNGQYQIDEEQKTNLEEKLNEWNTSSYRYSFNINLDGSSVAVTENGEILLKLDLSAWLNANSKINLILSGLKEYLEELLRASIHSEMALLNEEVENELASDFMVSSRSFTPRLCSDFSLENEEVLEIIETQSLAEEIGFEIEVSDLLDKNKNFNANKALNLIQSQIAKTEYASVIEKVDLSSYVKSLEKTKLTETAFPVQFGEAVQLEINPLEESTPSKPSKPSSHKPATPKPEENKPSSGTVGKKSLYRFYNTLTGEHFFTSDEKERDTLLQDVAWSNEGQGWKTPEFSNYPIYRLCNPNNGDHHYTMDKNEYDTLQTYGWVGEGVGLYSAGTEDENIVLLHRLYNPNATGAGSHHYTADENERNELVKLGWTYEGTAWYGLTE